MEELQSLGQQRFHSGVTRGCTGPSGLPWPLLCPPEQEVTSSVSHAASSSIPHQQGLPTNPPLQITNTARAGLSQVPPLPVPCLQVLAPASQRDPWAAARQGSAPCSLPWHWPVPAAVPAPPQPTDTGYTPWAGSCQALTSSTRLSPAFSRLL